MAENTVPKDSALAKKEESAPTTREEERYLVPAVDIYETDDGLTLVADMPGVDKDKLDIRVEDGILNIGGHCSRENKREHWYKEFEVLDYWRQFTLSEEVNTDKISAELKHGVLTLDLPKSENAKPKQIDVRVE